jgi:hypothetical protein
VAVSLVELTQERLAQALGLQRTGVTVASVALPRSSTVAEPSPWPASAIAWVAIV